MKETAARSTVQFFPKPEWLETGCGPISCASCGSGCDAGPEDSQNLDEVIAGFQRDYADRAEVKVAFYDGETAILEAIAAINRLLESGGEEIRVNPDNFELFMSLAAPLVAIDDMFAFIGGAPTALELSGVFEMVTNGKEPS